jgi:solute carrier family 25 phosphate transporter 3
LTGPPEPQQPAVILSRRAVVGASAAAALAAVGGSPLPGFGAAGANLARMPSGSRLTDEQTMLVWQPSSEIRGKGSTSAYPVRFTTYLTRFLLNFDAPSREWWVQQGANMPLQANRDALVELRTKQFSQYSESVQLGLSNFAGASGIRQLYSLLRSRYGATRQGKLQLAILFSLLPPEQQPTDLIRRALGEADNATVASIAVTDSGAGYLLPPAVAISPPDAAGAGRPALARPKMALTGEVGALVLLSGGSGYREDEPPAVTVTRPADPAGQAARVGARVVNGSVEALIVLDPGQGYARGDAAMVTIEPPRDASGVPDFSATTAEARAYLSQRVESIEVVDGGFGYARDQRLDVSLRPVSLPAAAAWAFGGSTATFDTGRPSGPATLAAPAAAAPLGPRGRKSTVSRAATAVVELYTPLADMYGGQGSSMSLRLAGAAGSVSSEMLALLPSTLRPVRVDTQSLNSTFEVKLPPELRPSALDRAASLLGRDPVFGPLGTSPVQREIALKPADFLAFALSGAACTATVRTALVPIELTKTLMQSRPKEYPALGRGLRRLWAQGGVRTLYTGVDITFLLGFLLGGVGFGANEFLRRELNSMMGDSAPLYALQIQALASLGAVLASCMAVCPLEVLRVRAFDGVVKGGADPPGGEWRLSNGIARLYDEGGFGVLYSSLGGLLFRELPFTITKFVVFDAAVSAISTLLPSLAEGQTSYFVSLAAGAIAGVVGGAVSTPADTILTRRLAGKRAEEPAPHALAGGGEAVAPAPAAQLDRLRDEAASLFAGVGARCLLFGTVIAGQYVLYDFWKRLFKASPSAHHASYEATPALPFWGAHSAPSTLILTYHARPPPTSLLMLTPIAPCRLRPGMPYARHSSLPLPS